MYAAGRVEFAQYDLAWSEIAKAQADTLKAALGDRLVTVHHVGSTAIPHLLARPTVDLIAVLCRPADIAATRPALLNLGFTADEEDETVLTLDRGQAPDVRLQCCPFGSRDVSRQLAFRNYLRRLPLLIQRYESEKQRCLDLHPDDPKAYQAQKGIWIDRIETEAMAAYRV